MPKGSALPESTTSTGLVLIGLQAGGSVKAPHALVATPPDASITTAKLADSAVTAAKIGTGAVTETKLGAGAVTESKIGALAVTEAKLAYLAVSTAVLQNNAVTEAKLASGSVTEGKLGDGAVTALKIASNAVGTTKIIDAAISTAKLVDESVTEAKLGTGAVTAGKIGAGAVTEAKLGAGAVTADKIGAGAVTEAKLGSAAVTADKIGSGAVTEAKLAGNAVSLGKLATLSASRLMGRRSGSSGDVEAITIGAGLAMSAGGELSATASGSGAPVTYGIAYVDSSASGTGAAINNGVPFASLTLAYVAALAWVNAAGGRYAVIRIAGGSYSRLLSTTVGWDERISLEGAGELVTSVAITSSGGCGSVIAMHCNKLSLSVDVIGDTGSNGSNGDFYTQEGGTGLDGGSITISIWGARITSLTATPGPGGNGGNAYDNGSTPVVGGNGGRPGVLDVRLFDCIQAGDFTFGEASPGVGGTGSTGGSDGASGFIPSPTTEFRCHRLVQDVSPIYNRQITTNNNAGMYASRSDLGTVNSGNWVVSGCQYIDNAYAYTWSDTAGLPSATYPSGF